MDRMIYVAMSGAKQVMEQQSNTAHNLANLGTTGFRAQLDSFRSVPIEGQGLPTRAFVLDATTGSDHSQGVVQATGNPLDVAIKGMGWIGLQAEDGSEVYSRAGNLSVNDSGVLVGQGGLAVAGDGGPITLPPEGKPSIAPDGTISVMDARGVSTAVGRIRLVNPPVTDLERGDDGLFRMKSGDTPDADAMVRLAPGSLEGSNVNAVDAMVNLITLSRAFDLQMSLMKNAESNEAKASQILSMNP
ncbi:MAG: flagellar basal-body rod protein FlgF [Pseudomonadota bacterium]|jgi:flagellar basal-body rod protein FlgF